MTKQTSVTETKPEESRTVSPFTHMRDDLDRLFSDFASLVPMRQRLFDLDRDSNWPFFGAKGFHAADIIERNGTYEIDMEVPGFDLKDIEVSVSNGQLTIHGEMQEEKEEKDTHYHLSERSRKSFDRRFTLPDGIDRDRIEAKLSNGVLIVSLPKTKQAKDASKTKKINIKHAA